MSRTEATYGQLDRVARSLGFLYHFCTKAPPAHVYIHKPSGAILMFPNFPHTDFAYLHHVVGARTTLDLFSIAEPKEFDDLLALAANPNIYLRPALAQQRRKPARGQ